MQLLWINLIALLLTVSAQSTAPAPSTPSLSSTASSATVVPSTAAYSYVGCYNETTGDFASGNARALSGGSMVSSPRSTAFLYHELISYRLAECIRYHDRTTVLEVLRKVSIRWARVWPRGLSAMHLHTSAAPKSRLCRSLTLSA